MARQSGIKKQQQQQKYQNQIIMIIKKLFYYAHGFCAFKQRIQTRHSLETCLLYIISGASDGKTQMSGD